MLLREFKSLKQEPGPGSRRWFESDGFDLVVWFDTANSVVGFQICYDFGEGEHALTWRRGVGCAHDRVDGGDSTALKNQTPILVPDGAVPWADISRLFEDRCGCIEPSLREMVRRCLAERHLVRAT